MYWNTIRCGWKSCGHQAWVNGTVIWTAFCNRMSDTWNISLNERIVSVQSMFHNVWTEVRKYENLRKLLFTWQRSCSLAEYWKQFMARLNGVHAFGYNSARSEPIWSIWMKFGILWVPVHCLPLALADFGRDRHRSESERGSLNFFVR